MLDAWLIDREQFWCLRFHQDPKSWLQDPHVFIDHGRGMPNGEPALLKSRRYLRSADARLLWNELVKTGWKPTEAVWGADAEP